MGLTACKRENCDANFIVNQIVESFNTLANQKGLSIESFIPINFAVQADPALLNVIFRNLISNAVKYSHEPSNISIGTIKKNSIQYFFIQDHGVGISQDRLSELFSLVKNSSNQESVNSEFSSGLGLILCKEYVALHNGEIYAESEEAVGSTFYFSLG